MKLYEYLARTGEAHMRTLKMIAEGRVTGADEAWKNRHENALELAAKEWLPSGSGLDTGCRVAYAGPDKITIETAFHHMNEHGFYDGWTEHRVTVRPTLTGLDIKISGENRNEIKEYLGELFHGALTADVEP